MADKKAAFKVLKRIQTFFSKKGIKYETHSDEPRLYVSYSADNFDRVRFIIDLSDDGKLVSYHAYTLFKANEESLPAHYKFCNAINAKYRWIRVYMDSDDEGAIALDAVLTEKTAGEECYELLGRMVSITDDVIGEYKKVF